MNDEIRKSIADDAGLIDKDIALASRGNYRTKSSRRPVCHVLG